MGEVRSTGKDDDEAGGVRKELLLALRREKSVSDTSGVERGGVEE